MTLRLLGDAADPDWRARVEAVPQVGCTVKLNVALKELPSFTARPGTRMPHHLGQINTPLSKEEWRTNYQVARAGELPERLWTELYFQTAHDPERRARGRAHDERFRPVRARTPSPRAIGKAAATRSRTWRSARSPAIATTCPGPSSTSRCSARPTSSAKSA